MKLFKSVLALALCAATLAPMAQAKGALTANLPKDLNRLSVVDAATICGIIVLQEATEVYANTDNPPAERARLLHDYTLRGVTWAYVAFKHKAPPNLTNQWADRLEAKNDLTPRHYSYCWAGGLQRYNEMSSAEQELVDEQISMAYERIRKSVQAAHSR